MSVSRKFCMGYKPHISEVFENDIECHLNNIEDHQSRTDLPGGGEGTRLAPLPDTHIPTLGVINIFLLY